MKLIFRPFLFAKFSVFQPSSSRTECMVKVSETHKIFFDFQKIDFWDLGTLIKICVSAILSSLGSSFLSWFKIIWISDLWKKIKNTKMVDFDLIKLKLNQRFFSRMVFELRALTLLKELIFRRSKKWSANFWNGKKSQSKRKNGDSEKKTKKWQF